MAVVEVRDYALWIKHIHGAPELKAKLLEMTASDLIELVVDGVSGHWVKMDDGSDGRPTPGIKAIGKAKTHWHGLQDRRGDVVTIEEA